MSTVLQIENLTKRYGKITAVNGLDLTVKRGTIFGILGPNGSGKTTTLGMALGVINPTAGKFTWFERESGHQARKRIGAILESPSFYHYLSARQNLKVTATIKEVGSERIPLVLERVGLLERADDPFKTYSLGMKQRLAIASALLSDPEVMILDEPTNGLDPQGIAEIRELIIELGAEGRTIILASHLLSEVQRICTDFAVLRNGKKIYQGKVYELASENQRIRLSADDMEKLHEVLGQCAMISSVRREGPFSYAVLNPEHTPSDLNEYLFQKSIVVSHLEPESVNLEQKFLEILKEGGHA
jgi:ABC-2 type transport system ATP-binding protein